MARIFISYKRADYYVVYKIKQRIESSLQTECWMDLEGISGIQQFPVEICNAISQCDVFLFMYSKEHLKITDFDNDWTLKELSFASAEKKKIVLVHIDDAKLKGVFSFNYSTYNNIDARVEIQFNKLLNDIRQWLSTPSNGNCDNVVEPRILTTEYPGVVIENEVLKKVPWNFSGEFIIGENVASIGDMACWGCGSLTHITIPNSITSIGHGVFSKCTGLTSVTIPNSVTRIGEYAFEGCENLANVVIPNSVTSIGAHAFEGCKNLANVVIPNSVTSIGKCAFRGCASLTDVIIPNSVISIDKETFWGCKGLTHVTISNSITRIEDHAFGGCTGLTNLTIPSSVISVGFGVFDNCDGLKNVTLSNVIIEKCGKVFEGCRNLQAVFVPKRTKKVFQFMLDPDLQDLIIER